MTSHPNIYVFWRTWGLIFCSTASRSFLEISILLIINMKFPLCGPIGPSEVPNAWNTTYKCSHRLKKVLLNGIKCSLLNGRKCRALHRQGTVLQQCLMGNIGLNLSKNYPGTMYAWDSSHPWILTLTNQTKAQDLQTARTRNWTQQFSDHLIFMCRQERWFWMSP